VYIFIVFCFCSSATARQLFGPTFCLSMYLLKIYNLNLILFSSLFRSHFRPTNRYLAYKHDFFAYQYSYQVNNFIVMKGIEQIILYCIIIFSKSFSQGSNLLYVWLDHLFICKQNLNRLNWQGYGRTMMLLFLIDLKMQYFWKFLSIKKYRLKRRAVKKRY
jgi:hypothetical protein